MNQVDENYLMLCEKILAFGKKKQNRTGVDTLSLFGEMSKYDFTGGFPILTTKKVNFDALVYELLWFISGDTNIQYLLRNNVNIWNGDAYRNYQKKGGKDSLAQYLLMGKGIPDHSDYDLGIGTYGSMWRDYPFTFGNVDQLSKVIETLKTNPDDRRMIVNAWHPGYVDKVALPPCHVIFQFNTEVEYQEDFIGGHKYEKRKLNLAMYQRSADMFLGVPFNITSYALLLSMVAHCVNMIPGELTIFYGDCHIYINHLEQIQIQMQRESLELPKLLLCDEVKNIFDFKRDHIALENYNPHPAIKGEVSTKDINTK